MLVPEGSPTDKTDPTSEDTHRFQSQLQSPSLKLILEKHVYLALTKNTQDYLFFAQVFPVFKTPAFYVIKNGVVVDLMVDAPSDSNEFLERIQKLEEPSMNVSSSNEQFNEATQGTSQSIQSSASSSTVASASVDAKKQDSKMSNSDTSASQKKKESETSAATSGTSKSKSPKKEQAPEPQPDKNDKDKKRMLQFKLPNGLSIKKHFDSPQKLNQVFEYVSKNLNLKDQPFSLLQSVPSRTFKVQGNIIFLCF
jgi:hypothetical protein